MNGDNQDRLIRIFQSPWFLSLTIGVPFCLYKILFGILMIRVGSPDSSWLVGGGFLVLLWAGLDLLMNLSRAALDLIGRGDIIAYCTLAELGRILSAELVFLALDTLITFSIICYVLWSGWIVLLSPPESACWYVATTLNLISLSVVSLFHELIRYRRGKERKK